MWAGNVFLSENKDLQIILVADGQALYKPPFLEIYNPTAETIKTEIYSPPGTPEFGGMRRTVTVPPYKCIRIARSEWKQK